MFDVVLASPLWFLCFFFRYLRLLINLFAFCLHRPIPVPETPKLTADDVTVVIPSLGGDGPGLERTILSILDTEPFHVLLVTIEANEQRARLMVKRLMTDRVTVLTVAQPNKRRQMVRAIPHVSTSITVFADDDVIWPSTLLRWMLAPLESDEYGGVGTNQRLRRPDSPNLAERLWGFLGAVYLQRRNFDCAACNYMDGGLPCLSGRTVAYRTKIISDDAFQTGFTNEVWGWGQNYRLNADDDNFITRWLVSHGHRIAFQYHREAEVQTELESNAKYLKQCLRWSRSNWRSNLTTMFVEGHVWSLQPWSLYAVFLTTLTHWALLWDVGLLCFSPASDVVFWTLVATMLSSKVVKLVPLLVREPLWVLFVPLSIVFGYLHGLIKLYAGLTLNVTAWGSREGADDNDAYRMIHITRSERTKAAEIRASEVYTQ